MNDEQTKELPQKAEIVELCDHLLSYAVKQGWSQNKLLREFPALGSDRTFRDMRSGNLEGYDVEAQLQGLRSAWQLAQELSGASTDGEWVFDDLSTCAALRRACLTAMRVHGGSNRVVIVLGQSGVGKSTALRVLKMRYGQRVAVCEASDVWNDRPAAMLAALLRAIGYEGNMPGGAVDRLNRLVERLGQSRTCIALDEAHHCGPHCLNVLKTLVNRTPGEFILLAIPTLWSKLESQNYIEARQLSTNRLSERVTLELSERDIADYLTRACPKTFAEAKLARSAGKLLLPAAKAFGNLAFVRAVAAQLPTT